MNTYVLFAPVESARLGRAMFLRRYDAYTHDVALAKRYLGMYAAIMSTEARSSRRGELIPLPLIDAEHMEI